MSSNNNKLTLERKVRTMSSNDSKLTLERKRELARLLNIKKELRDSRRIDYFKPRKGIQEAFHKSDAKIRCFSGGNQPIPLDDYVLMADGTKKRMGDILAGDYVLGSDTKGNLRPSMVNYIVRPGKKKVYELLLQDGETIRGTEDHPYLAYRSQKRAVKDDPEKITIGELLKLSRPSVLYCRNIEFNAPKSIYSGLLFGLFLGDGCSQGGNSHKDSFTSEKEEYHSLFKKELLKYYSDCKYTRYKSNPTQGYITKKKLGNEKTKFSKDLFKLGLYEKKSWEKFIPKELLMSDAETRKQLLRGLILTDGCVDSGKATYYTNSYKLAMDVRFLLLTFGIRSSVRERIRKGQGCLFHRSQYYVNFSLYRLNSLGIDLLNKNRIYESCKKRFYALKVKSAKYIGEMEVGCINIDHPDHLFVLSNGILTGNSGKTTSLVVEGIWTALGTHPYRNIQVPNVGMITSRNSFERGIKQVILPKLYEWLPRNSVVKEKKNQQGIVCYIQFVNGSEIHLMSGEMDNDSFESNTIDWAAFDEPIAREKYIGTLRGLMKKKGSMWLAFTPLSEAWMYDDLWLKGLVNKPLEIDGVEYNGMSIESFQVDTYDNCVDNGGYLTKEEIMFYESQMSDDERETRIGGKFRSLAGLVYKKFDPPFHIIEDFPWPKDWPVYRAIDPHVNKPHHVVWVGVTNDEVMVVIDELKIECTLPDLAALILDKDKQYNVVESLIDPAINVNDGIYRINQREVLERSGLRLRFPCKRDNLIPGIMEIQRLLDRKDGKCGLYFMRKCSGVVYEMMRYQWDEHGKPKKTFDDFMDCYDKDTEVLTIDGWKYFSDVTYNDMLCTLNLDNSEIEYQKPELLIKKRYADDMAHFNTRKVDIKVTKTHNMVVYSKDSNIPKLKKACDVLGTDTIVLTGNWHNNYPEKVDINGIYVNTLDFAEFLGWFISEGSLEKPKFPGRGYGVLISQSNEAGRSEILKLLERLPWNFYVSKDRFGISNKKLWNYLKDYGNTYTKAIPKFWKNMGKDVCNRLIKTLVMGDGWYQGSGRCYCTVSKTLADDIQELFMKIGVSAGIIERYPKPYNIRGRYGDNTKKQYWVMEHTVTRGHIKTGLDVKIKYTEYDDFVYCASVKNKTLYVRRNNKPSFCGNCLRYIVISNPVYERKYKKGYLANVSKLIDSYGYY